MTETLELHCPSCLDGKHRRCGIYTPSSWEGGGGRCVCRCQRETLTRLTQVEDRCVPPPVPRKRGPKPGSTNATRKWTDDAIRELVELEKRGLTSRQIGEEVGAHMDTVRTYLKRAREKGWR